MCESLGQLESRIGDSFGQMLDDLLVLCPAFEIVIPFLVRYELDS